MLAAFGCGANREKQELMSHEDMVSYLIDLHLAEAEVQNLRLKKDSSEAVFAIYEKHLQDEHGITDTLFVQSYNYYLAHPDELEQIYEAIVDSISVRKSKEEMAK